MKRFTLINFLEKRKYELLLVALIMHLYIGVVLDDMDFYMLIIWPINMLILGAASIGVFFEKGVWRKRIKNILFVLILLLPIIRPVLGHLDHFMVILSFFYAAFFIAILREVFLFLIRPSYINVDLITAAACGYFLLIEICVFVLQATYYQVPGSLNNLDSSMSATIFMDLVYFSTISITSIGFGDISPGNHHTKLLVAFFGTACQFYMVVLIGLLISKFSSSKSPKTK